MIHNKRGTEENRAFKYFHRDLMNPTVSSSSRMDAASTEQLVDTITRSTIMTEEHLMMDAGKLMGPRRFTTSHNYPRDRTTRVISWLRMELSPF
jgi:hypothetical protein